MELRDGETRYFGLGVQKAVKNVNTKLKAALLGKNALCQLEIDRILMDADGTHNYMLGGSTIREATAAEKEAEKASFPGPEPSREEQLEAQVAALQSQVDALLGVSE